MNISLNRLNKNEFFQKRKIKPTRRSASGFVSFRGEAKICYESALERDFIVRHEFFLNVIDIFAQPVTIPFVGHQGVKDKYTPDFLVQFRLGGRSANNFPKPILAEVKYEEDWKENWRDWLPKWKAAYRYAKDNDMIFRIYDEHRIRDQVLGNIQYLERYKKRDFDECETQQILNTVMEMGRVPFHYLLARYFMGDYRAMGIAHLWHLVANRRLDCDVHEPLNIDTILWVPNDG